MARGDPVEFTRILSNDIYQRCGNVVQVSGQGSNAYPLTVAHTEANVNGDTLVLAANANREYALLVNDSDTVIYINITGGAAAANEGIRLNAGGGSYEMSWAYGNLVLGAIRANHGGVGNKLLLITEGT